MRLFKLLSVTVAAGALIAMLAVLPSRLCFKKGNCYVFFTGDTSADCRQVTVTENADGARLALDGVCGECTVYDSLDIARYLESVNGEIIFTESLSDSVNYYCRADLPYSAQLYGERINLHICVRADGVKVASPIIFGGY